MNMRLYLDTSVFGGYFEPEFEKWTKRMFETIIERGDTILVSTIVLAELENAPPRVRDLFVREVARRMEMIERSTEAIALAERYVVEKVIGRSSMADCQHIAIATLANADALVSWNFKHIVNVPRIRGYNSVNMRMGHRLLEIRTPFELMSHGE
ncbi:MAG: PIN domain-containing protein [Flavobacteriales bacterium]|nr:PIN domain-containing protein [Flavobacteriales bacterium]